MLADPVGVGKRLGIRQQLGGHEQLRVRLRGQQLRIG
jgi:hypothetical protein